MKWRLATILLILSLFATLSRANERAQGYCVTAAGTRSLSCTVTVYLTGTTQLATIYADNVNTPQSNPFQADPTVGAWVFYAGNARYDINLSGGNPSISPAFTISDVLLFDPQSFGPMNASALSVLSNPGNIAQDPLITTNYDNMFSYQVPIKTLTTTANSIGNALIAQMSGIPGPTGAYGTNVVSDFTNLGGKYGVGFASNVYLNDISSVNHNVTPAILSNTNILGTANWDYVTGVLPTVKNMGSGVISIAAGFTAPGNLNSGTGSINESLGFEALDQGNVGTSFNAGIVISAQTAGVNNYGVYSAPTNKDQLGNITTGSINNFLYVDGVENTTLAAAFAKCPASGCVIDMRGNSSSLATTLGVFDPLTTPVTILLGPFNYTLQQLTVRSGLQLIGLGHNATFITQANGSIAPIQLPGASQVYPNNVANGVTLKGFNLSGAVSNTTDGLSFVANASATGPTCNGGTGTCGGGLWYSEIEDVTVGAGRAFGRNAIRFDSLAQGSATESTNQFNSMKNVAAFRAANGSAALNIVGPYTGQLSVEASQFDGPQARTDTTAVCNISIGDGGSSTYLPYSIVFKNVTSQWAWHTGSAAICLSGVLSFTSQGGHFENDEGIITEAIGGGGHGNWATRVTDSYIATSSVDSGNGYIASVDTNSNLVFDNNSYYGTAPDSVFLGTGGTGCLSFAAVCNISSTNNSNGSSGGYEPWNQISEGFTCTLSSGVCTAVNLRHAYQSGTMACSGNWNGTGTLTGILSFPVTVNGGTHGGTVTPTSTVTSGGENAHIQGTCTGIGQ